MSKPALNFSPAPDVSVNFDELLERLDAECEGISLTPVDRFCFTADGLNFDVRRRMGNDGQRFWINATLGYLPFSIESAIRREAVKTIVEATRFLPNVRFNVDMSSKISAGALFDRVPLASPDFIFYPLTLFLQEARPFINLIGKYLVAPSAMEQK